MAKTFLFSGRRQLGGDVRIVVVVRDPVERAWSSYRYNYLGMAGLGRRPASGRRSTRRREREVLRRSAEEGEEGVDKFQHASAILSDDGRIERVEGEEGGGHGDDTVSFEDFVEAEMEWIRSCMGRPSEIAKRDMMAECLTDPTTLDEQWRGVKVGGMEASSAALVRSMLGRGFYQAQVSKYV